MKKLDGKSLKVYILENYDKYWDMSSKGYQELSSLLDAYNASFYTKKQFCSQFGLKEMDFFDLLRLLVNPKNYEFLVDMGKKFAPKVKETNRRKKNH